MNNTITQHFLLGFNSIQGFQRTVRIPQAYVATTAPQARLGMQRIIDGNGLMFGTDNTDRLASNKFCRLYTNSTNRFDPIFFE